MERRARLYRFFGVVGLAAFALTLAACGGSSQPPPSYKAAGEEIDVFLQDAMPAIFDPFDYGQMMVHSSPDLNGYTFPMHGLFKTVGAVSGDLKSYEVESKEIGYDLQLDYHVDADMYAIYVLSTEFDYTRGTVRLQMARQDERWWIVLWDVRNDGL